MPETAVAFTKHDHRRCIQSALSEVEQHCSARGLRLTPVRRRVLEILLESHTALGGYDVLERLNAEGLGSQPPVAYRALDFLVQHGFAHKLERLSAFVACCHPLAQHEPAFMICRNCKLVAESAEIIDEAAIGHSAEANGFKIEHKVVEIEGLCLKCQTA